MTRAPTVDRSSRWPIRPGNPGTHVRNGTSQSLIERIASMASATTRLNSPQLEISPDTGRA